MDHEALDRDAFELAEQMLDACPAVAFENFGPYRINSEPIGKGGMGEVFLAEDTAAGRWVAIKFLRNVWSAPDLRQRFTHEIRMLAKLEHPFIARLYDAGIHPSGTPYFVMEYVNGKPLDEYCRLKKCSLNARLQLFRAVCEAVQYAHSRLVVHRDLKPSNILVLEGGTPKLLDFGIAKQLESLDQPASQTQTELRFTQAFAAPEQLRREPVGVYTDVYALGVILYELLAGKPPYDLAECTPGEAEFIITGAQEPQKPSNLAEGSDDLDVLCLTAMKKDVERRYPSVVELIQDLDHYLKGEPLKARPDTLSYRLNKFVRRNLKEVAAVAIAAMLLLGLATFFTLRLAKERDHANRQTAIATAMNRFLSENLLEQTDPFKSGVKESFADVVNRASPQIDSQFRAEPLVAARLHWTIAKALQNRSNFSQARQEYERAYTLFQQGEGPLSQDAVAVRLQQSAMETRSGDSDSVSRAQSLLTSAQETIAGLRQPREDLAVWVSNAQGSIAIMQNDARAANSSFSDAVQRAQKIPWFDERAQLRLKQLLAFSYLRLGEGANGEQQFREIVQGFSRVAGAESSDAVRARVNLSQAFLVERKYSDAIREINILYPALVKQVGQEHEFVITMLATRAAAEGSLAMWNEAIRDDLDVHTLASKTLGPFSVQSVASLADASLSQCRSGRYAEGEANARLALQQSKQTVPVNKGLIGGSSFSLATCLLGTNRLNEAAALLATIDLKAAAQLSGDNTVGAGLALAQAEIDVKRGNYESARRKIQQAAPVFAGPNPDVGEMQVVERLNKEIAGHLRASR